MLGLRALLQVKMSDVVLWGVAVSHLAVMPLEHAILKYLAAFRASQYT